MTQERKEAILEFFRREVPVGVSVSRAFLPPGMELDLARDPIEEVKVIQCPLTGDKRYVAQS